jgi:hypothetical protein
MGLALRFSFCSSSFSQGFLFREKVVTYINTPSVPAKDLILANTGAININFFSFLHVHNPNGKFESNNATKHKRNNGLITTANGIDKNTKPDNMN